jgi:hypothetical protein
MFLSSWAAISWPAYGSIFGLIRAREASSTRRRLVDENYRSGASAD